MPDMSEAWIEGQDDARWRSAALTGPGTGAAASGSSLLEVDPGCRLARHVDSAEETVVVVAGRGVFDIDGSKTDVAPGSVVLIPAGAPHEARNAGGETLRFAAVYASTDVTTTYEQPVQPAGDRERTPIAT